MDGDPDDLQRSESPAYEHNGLLQIDLGKTEENTKIDLVILPGYDNLLPDSTKDNHAEHTFTIRGFFWIRDLLQVDLQDARIFLFVYSAEIAFASDVSVQNHAENFLRSLKSKRSNADRPIMMMGHSMGGIFVKEALGYAQKVSDLQPIARDTYCIIFLGTPHSGAPGGVTVSDIVHSIASALVQKRDHKWLDSIKNNSRVAQRITEQYNHLLKSFFVVTAFEEKPTNGIMVVDERLATLNLPENRELRISLNRNHLELVKFHVRDHDYKLLRIQIRDKTIAALRAVASREQIGDPCIALGNTSFHSMPCMHSVLVEERKRSTEAYSLQAAPTRAMKNPGFEPSPAEYQTKGSFPTQPEKGNILYSPSMSQSTPGFHPRHPPHASWGSYTTSSMRSRSTSPTVASHASTNITYPSSQASSKRASGMFPPRSAQKRLLYCPDCKKNIKNGFEKHFREHLEDLIGIPKDETHEDGPIGCGYCVAYGGLFADAKVFYGVREIVRHVKDEHASSQMRLHWNISHSCNHMLSAQPHFRRRFLAFMDKDGQSSENHRAIPPRFLWLESDRPLLKKLQVLSGRIHRDPSLVGDKSIDALLEEVYKSAVKDWQQQLFTPSHQPSQQLVVPFERFQQQDMSTPGSAFDPTTLMIPDTFYDNIMHNTRSNYLNEQSSHDVRLFHVGWDVVKCMHARYKEDIPSIGPTIVLTGTVLQAQATTCEYYIKQRWPKTGMILVEALDAFVKDQHHTILRSGSASHHLGTEILVRSMPYGLLTVSVIRCDDSFSTEIAQQLSWLGSALSISPFDEKMAYAESIFSETDSNYFNYIYYTHEMLPASETACWLALFSEAVIAFGFPIPDRANEVGLEISIGLLAALSGVRHAVEFQGGVLMKGFSNLFVPIRKSNGIIQWHAVYSVDPSTHLTYQEGLSQCESRALLEEVSLDDLQTCRHIVGWCSAVQSRLGSDRANYENIHYSTATDAKPSVKYTNASLGFQQFGLAEVDFKLGVAEGKCHFKRDGPYRNIVTWAEKTLIVLYDTAERRGWLVPASEVMLHIIQCRHRQEPFEVNGSRIALDTNVPVYSSAKDVLLRNMSTRLSDDVEHTFKTEIASIWSLLDFLIAENVAREKNSPGHTIRTTRGEILHGFEFNAVVEQHSPFRQKQTDIRDTNGGWPLLSRDIDALVLLANGFEDILVPAMEKSRSPFCRSWQYVPKYKDFLASSTRSLLKLYERAGCSLDRKFLTSSGSKLQWHQGSSLLFDPCTDPGHAPCQCVRLQQILPKSTVTSIIPPEHVVDYGGVIFGHIASTLVKVPKPSRTPMAKVSGIYSQENSQLPFDVRRDDCREEGTSSSDIHGRESLDTALNSRSRSSSPATTSLKQKITYPPRPPVIRKRQLSSPGFVPATAEEFDETVNNNLLHLDSRAKRLKNMDLQYDPHTFDVDCSTKGMESFCNQSRSPERLEKGVEVIGGSENGLPGDACHQTPVSVDLTGKNDGFSRESFRAGELAIHAVESKLPHSLRRQQGFTKTR